MDPIVPCLWFDTEGADAAQFYTSLVPNSRIVKVTHYGSAQRERAGEVLTVEFELNGQPFLALNGGPQYRFNPAVSFQILCDTQEEVDRYWDAFADGGKEVACGWVEDRFGLSWQVVPKVLPELLADPDPERAQRVMACMMEMVKLDIAELERAAA
ncbi:MAG: VOC family protein [Actinobacteria bacterium]|nr:VOC family protein [Actinomycetota bacterium]